MKKCAFLTTDNLEGFFTYDELLHEPLREFGWEVSHIPWRAETDWNRFDAVVIRSPWDYQDDPEHFLRVLETIDNSHARLENALSLVKWNIHKKYLRDLEERGIFIVPTLWEQRLNRDILGGCFNRLDTDEIIVKPAIGANADDTYRLSESDRDSNAGQALAAFSNRACMIQPFIRSITKEGEFSLFYFGNTYSHTILKTPKKGDFRVQEEHGGRLKTVEPDQGMKKRAREVLDEVHPTPLYSRIDFVRYRQDFALMELELIEPSLYFNMDPDSPRRFARVFNDWMKDKVEKSGEAM